MLKLSAPLALVLCTAAVSGAVNRANAQVVFSDNFNSGASALWGNQRGNWTASNGTYFAQSPSNNPLTISSLPFSLTNFTIDVDINKLQDGGIWLRSDGVGQNGVLLVTGGNLGTGTGLYWHVFVNGSAAPAGLNPVTGLFTSGVSNAHIKVTVTGNTFAAYVNGASTPATTLTDNTYTSGRVGLYDFSNQTFDNVVVTAAPEPGSLVFLMLGGLSVVSCVKARKRKALG